MPSARGKWERRIQETVRYNYSEGLTMHILKDVDENFLVCLALIVFGTATRE
jgi:hypothetical protein